MNLGKTIFSQIMDFLPCYEFQKCANRYQGNYKVRKFSCYEQFLCMSFAQLTYRESLRDIETCLRAMQTKTYHMGMRHTVSRSTLSDANEKRDWRIYKDFASVLITTARKLYANEDIGVDLSNTLYALDTSTIDLCLSLFPWAYHQRKKSAIKLHTLMDIRGNIPVYINITDAKIYDTSILDHIIPETGAFYIMDRGYTDFIRLYALHQAHSFFVIRSKINFKYRRLYSHPIDKSTGLRCDQTIVLTGTNSKDYYPEKLRRIQYVDLCTNKRLDFLTNNFILPAITIPQLYKFRWQIELFFKWIKQHLRIKSFYGTSPNAVKTQIWIAISIYVLVAIIKKRLNLQHSLYTILQIFSVTIFEKIPISRALELNMCKDQNIDFDKCLYFKGF